MGDFVDGIQTRFKRYELPKLPYEFNALEPHISGAVLEPHYINNHKGYVDNANKLLERYERIIAGEITSYDVQGVLRALTFNVNGHKLHSMFWKNLAKAGSGGGKPGGKIGDLIDSQYGSFDKFRRVFTEAASSLPGSGWTVLHYDKETKNLQIMTIENHFMNLVVDALVPLILDEFEHAFYMQYKTKRADYINAWWNVVNWSDADAIVSALG